MIDKESYFDRVKKGGFYGQPGEAGMMDEEPINVAGERKPAKSGRGIQSVDRALDILEMLAQSRQGLPLMELSARTGLNFSTCHHLLATMARRGYVSQDRRSKYYFLGNRIFGLSDGRTRQLDLLVYAKPALEELNRRTGEAVHLAVVEAGELVTLAKLDSLHAVKVDSGYVGRSKAVHATATGKAILAFQPEDSIYEMLARNGLPRFTDKTICGVEALKQELKAVREQGYSQDDEEFQAGVICFGAPIRDRGGKVVASVSASLPTMRASDAALAQLRHLVPRCADTISKELGYAEAA
jgi:DNA-binding IclR family transcriptional regulator